MPNFKQSTSRGEKFDKVSRDIIRTLSSVQLFFDYFNHHMLNVGFEAFETG